MNHTNSDDNITRTFNATYNNVTNETESGSHPAFWAGPVYIYTNTCPVLNTYQNNASQTSQFYEMALYDTSNMVYSTILEPDETGYNGNSFDFQMIVPEIGLPSFNDSTAYYIYIEIGT